MRCHSGSSARRILIACTAASLLGVASAFVDYGLARGVLWSDGRSSLGQELAKLAALIPSSQNEPAAALAYREAPQSPPILRPEPAELADTRGSRDTPELPLPRSAPPGTGGNDGQIPVASGPSVIAAADPQPLPGAPQEPPIYAASLTPADMHAPDTPQPPRDRTAQESLPGEAESPDSAPATPEIVLPAPEPVTKGASAALFLLSSSIAAQALAPEETRRAESKPAQVSVTAALASSDRASLPTRNPFVASASLAAAAKPTAPDPSAPRYSWSDLVRMASMKGGDGEEKTTIFGGLTEKEFRARELRCMATAIYFEARGESLRGQIAVGQVIMTRVRSDFYPNTICGVVFQGQWNRNSCQFSFACDGETDMPKEREQWATALDVAKQVIAGKVHLDDIGDATHYHAVYVRPDWRRQMQRVKQLGVHIFYKAPYVVPLAQLPEYQPL